MSEVSELDAQNRLGAILDEVEGGREVTITRQGRPVAKLVRVVSDDGRQLVEDARALRERIAARGERFTAEDIKSFVEDGRR